MGETRHARSIRIDAMAAEEKILVLEYFGASDPEGFDEAAREAHTRYERADGYRAEQTAKAPDLRQRYAEAIGAFFCGDLDSYPTTVNSIPPDAYRVADAALAVRDDELAALRAEQERADVAEARLRNALDDLAHSKDAHGRDVVRAVRAEAAVAHYENTITWHTTCHGCATLLDASYAETVRAEQAEAAIARVRTLAEQWATLAPADDWGDSFTDTLSSDHGRALLAVLDVPVNGEEE